jgi:hypothetical protein
MLRASVVVLFALSASACAYRPTPTEVIRIVDSPADVRACRRLGEVSDTVATVPGFGTATQSMLAATVALGGTDLYLRRQSRDWLLVRGIAYRCDPGPAPDTVVVRAAS